MSTTRSQKRKNTQQENNENVSEGFVSPVIIGNSCSSEQDVGVAGPSNPKSPRVENSLLESLRISLKEEITSEIKNLLIESQKEMLKLLKPNARENVEEEKENETRSFYTPTKLVRINSTQNDPNISRNITPCEYCYKFGFFSHVTTSRDRNSCRKILVRTCRSSVFCADNDQFLSTSNDFFSPTFHEIKTYNSKFFQPSFHCSEEQQYVRE